MMAVMVTVPEGMGPGQQLSVDPDGPEGPERLGGKGGPERAGGKRGPEGAPGRPGVRSGRRRRPGASAALRRAGVRERPRASMQTWGGNDPVR